jgi:hypothetical protein
MRRSFRERENERLMRCGHGEADPWEPHERIR